MREVAELMVWECRELLKAAFDREEIGKIKEICREAEYAAVFSR